MVKKFISAFLILLYLNVTVGVAVHRCGCGNSGKPEFFISENTCSCHKSTCCDEHEATNHHCEHEADDDHDCHGCGCKTEYKSASFDGAFFESGKIFLKNILIAEAIFAEISGHSLPVVCETANYAPPEAKKPPLIYQYCQLRL